MRVIGKLAWLAVWTAVFTGCAAREGSYPDWPSSPQADEQWARLGKGEDPFQREIVVVDPVDGARPLWNYEALGSPPRTIRVGGRYPVRLVEGARRRPEIEMTGASLHVWQGGVDLARNQPPPSFSVDLLSRGASLIVDQPSYWTYSCETTYSYKGETIEIPCRWTNFFSK